MIAKICDFCNLSPKNLEGTSGGDVRTVKLVIEGDASHNVNVLTESRTFDICHKCRGDRFGDVLTNILPVCFEADAPRATGGEVGSCAVLH